jgi:hypothetical protein
MKMAHLIMAFKDPIQIERLVKRLSHEGFDFYIHVDQKIDIQPFLYLGDMARVNFCDRRFLIRWGAYSFNNAIIESCKDILLLDSSYDFINVMSGQEYPIKPAQYIYNFFNSHIGYSFLSYEEFGTEWWNIHKERVEKYSMNDFAFKGRYLVQSFLNFILPKRKFPFKYKLYGGNCCTWWTLSRESIEYVINFWNKNSSLRFFAKFTHVGDEFIIATIIMNSSFKDKVVNNNFRYIDWTEGGPHPKILTAADFNSLMKSNKFFARKFDVRQDTSILDKLDTIL